MKRTFLILASILMCIACASAQSESQYKVRHDSLHVYLSWESMFDGVADTIIMNPEFDAVTPYNIEFDCIKKDLNKLVKNEAVAVAVGDTLWFVNSNWIKKNFEGPCKKMKNYVPLYFSAKVAFVQWAGFTVPEFFVNRSNIEMFLDDPHLYILDFDNATVEQVTSDKLIDLLDMYPDLKRRYQMMRDYDEEYMIDDFFLQYVERLSQDPSVPFLF